MACHFYLRFFMPDVVDAIKWFKLKEVLNCSHSVQIEAQFVYEDCLPLVSYHVNVLVILSEDANVSENEKKNLRMFLNLAGGDDRTNTGTLLQLALNILLPCNTRQSLLISFRAFPSLIFQNLTQRNMCILIIIIITIVFVVNIIECI